MTDPLQPPCIALQVAPLQIVTVQVCIVTTSGTVQKNTWALERFIVRLEAMSPDDSKRAWLMMMAAWEGLCATWDALQECSESSEVRRARYREWSAALNTWLSAFREFIRQR
jgi:hypothetical protein